MAKENEITAKTGQKLVRKGAFKPGADPRRNTKGRPEGSLNWTTYAMKALKRIRDKGSGKSICIEDIVFHQLQQALSSDSKQLTEVIERLFGKVRENIRIEGAEDDIEDVSLVNNFLYEFKKKK